MSQKIFKDGCRMTNTEYECRPLNADGDSIDVWHYETKAESIAAAKHHIAEGGLAVAVEKHISRYPAHLFDGPQSFTTLAVFGDKAALDLWGWEPGDSTWLEN